ncbi:MarR family winged helix-turn-helix transcriptional regulator [Pectinatus cerevisiiphilus]|uniref:MarR family transcriptional regulator n=1 Tax=Pectinatus cerevisiiphilus TaxID=86956 RepID=A0A4R3K6T1_9FIRM|nr:MarR family transcriptional regulator [Pectinatus cerevisiiphilus]TCS78401.1 MarR family transcriptional regulator [Pectinatus cerevisiiphilus]
MSDKKKISNDFLEVLFLMRHRIFRHISMPIPINQFAVMVLLSDEGSLTFSEIGERLSIIKQQLSPLIDRLENGGFVRRVSDTKDRRRVRIKMTTKGRQFINNHQQLIKVRLETTLATLSEEEIVEFGNSLHTLAKLFGKISMI